MRYLLISVIAFALLACNEKRESIFPKKTGLTEAVYASVTIQPDSLYIAYATVAGILDRNLVQEGDTVKKGEALMQIIDKAPKLNAENAKLSLQLARENYSGNAAILSGLEDEIRAAKLTFANDSINYHRQKRLWQQKIGSQAEFDNRRLAFELSRNNLNLLKRRYERTKNELRTQVRQAQNTYRSAEITTNDFTVTSKIDGKVYALMKEPGEIVTTVEPLAAIGSDSTFVIEMLVDEVDIVKLSVGQKALITLDAYGHEVLGAKVSKIYPRKDERSQTFTVEAVFENPPKVLYPGLAGEGNIVVSERDDVLTIPKEYLLENNQVMTADGPVRVSIGMQNLERVEIVEGIDENTELIKPGE